MGNYAFFPVQESRKMTYREWWNRGRWLTENSEITEDDLPGPSQFRIMTSRNRPGPGKSSSVVWWPRKVILLNMKSGFDETSWLKSSSGDKRFRLVVSRNCSGPVSHLPGTKKSRKVTLIGHLRNPYAAVSGFMLLLWDCIIKKKFFYSPDLQVLTADRMSLVSPPSSNGGTIPLRRVR